MEDKIKEAGEECVKMLKNSYSPEILRMISYGFELGAKSQVAKEFHTQGMYSEEDLQEAWGANGCSRWESFEEWFNSKKK